MRYVASVSWPRSGHYLLVRMLRLYFGSQFGYCRWYDKESCCRTVPCVSDVVHFSKNHDFDGSLEAPPLEVPLLVQHRDFATSVASWFDLAVNEAGTPDTPEQFVSFLRAVKPKYYFFQKKWVQTSRPNKLVLSYEYFTADPVGSLASVIPLFCKEEKVNFVLLNEIVANVDGYSVKPEWQRPTEGLGVRVTRDITSFRYFDELSREIMR
jgi:hypothetical protein